jgi:primosomal protein N' (replication factor Y)
MTYHKAENVLRCHYCGRREAVPETCPDCGSEDIGFFGTGTEKVDERVRKMFPGSKVARLDLDTMRKKGSADRIISDFENEKTDILIGTQVVAKGLDFRNVGLVGILSADISLDIPGFRSAAWTFQLITQAAGRAGRGTEPGRVLIQTYTPDNYAVLAAADHDYAAFYRQEIEFRRLRGYPPFSDFIQIVISGNEEGTVLAVASEWESAVRHHLGRDEKNVLPHTSMVSMAREGVKRSILIKCPKGSRKQYFDILMRLKGGIRGDKRKYSVTVDVNPYSMWRS